MKIEERVNMFKTKHEKGFTDKEVEELLKQFPDINMEKFNDSLFCNTCQVIEGEIINYKHDIALAINLGMENRDINFLEFD